MRVFDSREQFSRRDCRLKAKNETMKMNMNAKKTIALCLLLAAAFCASAKSARKSAAKNGEITMKEKIICEFLRKNGDVDIYDCFRFVCEDDSILKLYYIQK